MEALRHAGCSLRNKNARRPNAKRPAGARRVAGEGRWQDEPMPVEDHSRTSSAGCLGEVEPPELEPERCEPLAAVAA